MKKKQATMTLSEDEEENREDVEEAAVNQQPQEDEEELPTAPPEIAPPFTRNQLIQAQKEDEEMKTLWKDLETNPRTYYTQQDGILYARDTDPASICPLKIVVPKQLRRHVLQAGHDETGHFGKNKTRSNIQLCFYWPGNSKDTSEYCKQCPTCLKFGHHRRQKPLMQLVPTVTTPWKKIGIDIVGPLHRTKTGNKCSHYC